MKKICITMASLIAVVMVAFNLATITARADDTIIPGITIDGTDVSGMTAEEARNAVEAKIRELRSTQVTFIAVGGNKVTTTFGELGIVWTNPDVIEKAFAVGNEGNVIQRYKSKKDIEVNGSNFELELSCEESFVRQFVEEKCVIYDVPKEKASISKVNGVISVVGGMDGEALDQDACVNQIVNNLYANLKAGNSTMELPIKEHDAVTDAEDLTKIKDLLGSFTTSYSSSGSNRSGNVANGCSLINGTILYPGEEFSTYETVRPFTTENGYYLAGSYLNGQVVESLGGGICQVSSTLYNAVLRAELEVTQRYNHSMIVTYVQKSADAAIAESSGKDFKFKNNTNYPIYIEGYTEDKKITFNIYGVETRPSNRTIEFESEVISQTVPETDVITPDAGQPIGYCSVTSAHIGYRANLWKITYENGVEVKREQINSSNYAASPRTAIVGVGTSNPDYYNAMMAAVASGSVDQCKAMAAHIKSLEAAPPAAPPAE